MEQVFSNAHNIDQKKLVDVVESFSTIGIALPNDFVGFMSIHNGSAPSLNMFDTIDDPVNTYEMIEFYKLEDLMGIYMEWRKIIGDDWLPISRDGGGNQLVMNTKNTSINFCIWDEGEFPIFRKISSSFNDFVEKLYYDDTDLI